MKIKCLAENLSKAVKAVATCVLARSTLPVTRYVEIGATTDNNRAYIRATDLEKIVTITFGAKVEEPGKLLLPYRRLARFVAYEHGRVDISTDEKSGFHTAHLADGEGRVNVLMVNLPDPKELPDVVAETAKYHLSNEFIAALYRACPFCAPEKTRPVLTAVSVDSDGNGTTNVVSADGFRLFRQILHIPAIGNTLPAGKWLIPRDTCTALYRTMLKAESVKVGYSTELSPARIWFDTDNIHLVSQLVQGNFPAYESLIPKNEPEWKFTVSGPLLQSRVSQFEPSSSIARLTCTPVPAPGGPESPRYLKISMKDEEEGEFETTIPATMTGDGKIGINHLYLVQIAKLFSEVTMEVTTPSAPIKCYGDLEGVTLVCMPMLLQW